MAALRVRAVYEYQSTHEDDLPFAIGQVITVTDEDDPEWYGGEYVDDLGVKQEGIFPRNFVEKFEPTAPPRPVRSRKKDPEPAPLSPPPPPAATAPPEPPVEEAPIDTSTEIPSEDVSENRPPVTAPAPPPPTDQFHPTKAPPAVPVANPPVIASVPAPAPIETQDVDSVGSPSVDAPPKPKSPPPPQAQVRSPPPPVSQKPSSNSFRDRIAAFNKPAAPPVAPFKPSGLGSGSSGFIKKPFVAPPPSRHAYVPPPQSSNVAKVYRREEDPTMKETQAESADADAEKPKPAPTTSSEAQDEDQPKPTTLKERIALLQKQQAEAAQRLAGAATKKEKPARPPKKRVDSDAPSELPVEDQATSTAPTLGRKDSADFASKGSLDEPRSARQSMNISRVSTGIVEHDGNEADVSGAGGTTEGQTDVIGHEDSPEKLHQPAPQEGAASEEQALGGGEADDEDDVDPEVRRKEELRARMAKMSGGMGMAGMFGGPMMGLPSKKPKPTIPVERRPSELSSEGPASPGMSAPPIPTMMALPGMSKQKQPEVTHEPEPGQDALEQDPPAASVTDSPSLEPEPTPNTIEEPPPVPAGRPAPPPIPTDSRPPPPPPPPAAVLSPSVGSESDDELSESTSKPTETLKADPSPTSRRPPPLPTTSPPLPTSPRFSNGHRDSNAGDEVFAASPPASPQRTKRNSRPPPPIPGFAPPTPTSTRPPPPPPPGNTLSRASTADEPAATPMIPGQLNNGEEGDNTEYEGDYDTDIAPSAHHKDALEAQARGSSLDDSSPMFTPAADVPPGPPPSIPNSTAPRAGPPPIPTPSAPSFRSSVDVPRAMPPPIPSQPPPPSRASVDVPRAAPPPPPPKQTPQAQDDDYDPYNYNAAQTPPIRSQSTPVHELEEGYAPYQAPPPPPPSSTDRRPPPLAPATPRAPPRRSSDILRPPVGKRSMDVGRPSISAETGFMANEVDLASHTQWWLQPQGVPPIFQGRKDVYTESNESSSTEDGRNFVTKELSTLFQDYSQTVITVRFDPNDPSQTEMDQRHEPPPRTLRQDELEEAYERFGRQLAQAATSKKDSIVGDGTPQAFVHELLRPLKEALLPVGTRAYGALVYANLANAATQLNDEIRPGDIISIRNAKFQGKHGPMHAKYTAEIGKPDHVAIVSEWDGTKKKVRAWEQGRENKKVKQESFKLEDLRSGEVKIWRVMPRTWVGWSAMD
ncbi:hypothetical protein F4808DRAFT_117247 [Astrocystis sublimbata]|nr:hypothetical protein F4808DRAFT_117247 [Astrocystis sublimbata]